MEITKTFVPVKERRLTDQLEQYWNGLRALHPLPNVEQVEPKDLGDLWDDCFLVRLTTVEKEGVIIPAYEYRYLGENIRKMLGEEIITEAAFALTEQSESKFEIVRQTSEIYNDDGMMQNKRAMVVKYRQILLPIGMNGKVDHVLGGMRYKAAEMTW